MAKHSPNNSKRKLILISVLLFLVVLGIFVPAINNGFTDYDDNDYVIANADVQRGLTWHNVGWALRSTEAANWHPLTWLSHMLDCQLYGLNPRGHHFTSVLLHAFNTVLVFLVLAWMTRTVWRSLFVAALFGLHPLHVESVAWIAERKDVLSTLFWLLAMLAYAAYTRKFKVPGSRFKVYYSLTLLLFGLGLMCKPMLVTLPLALLLLDYWPLNRIVDSGVRNAQLKADAPSRISWRAAILEKLPFFALATAASVITVIAQQKGGAVHSVVDYPLGTRLANAVVSYGRYLSKFIWPEKLSVFYPYPEHWPGLGTLLAGVLLLGISSFVIAVRRRSPYLPVGWFWFIGTLVPVIGLVQVGTQSMADRYSYIPSIGLFIMISWGVYELTKSWRQQAIILSIASAAVLALSSVLTVRQINYWQDSETLFLHAEAVTTNNGVACNHLGDIFLHRGLWDEAIAQYQEAVKLNPPLPARTHNNLGAALKARGRLDEAMGEFQQAVKLDMNFAEAYANLGDALAEKGQLDEAITQFEKALTLNPNLADTHCDLGSALAIKGKTRAAMLQFQTALSLNPNSAEAHYDLAITLENAGDIAGAVNHYKRTLELQPDYPGAKERLGRLINAKQ